MVWDAIPMQLAKENKKFFFGQIKKGARSSEFEVAIQWLLDCGLIYKVNRVNEPHMPLKAYQSMNAYKLFMMDVGLLGALSELPAEAILEGNDIFVEFKGALTEQYVLQQMISDTPYTPYYYGTDKGTFEQDFLIQKPPTALCFDTAFCMYLFYHFSIKKQSNVRYIFAQKNSILYRPKFRILFL